MVSVSGKVAVAAVAAGLVDSGTAERRNDGTVGQRVVP